MVIAPTAEQVYEPFEVPTEESADKENVTSALLSSGLWPMIVQRPYGIIADPGQTPKAVFVSGFDSAPLAPDMNYVLEKELDNLNTGFAMLSKLTPGKVYLGLKAGASGVLDRVKGVEVRAFDGRIRPGTWAFRFTISIRSTKATWCGRSIFSTWR